MSRKIKVLALSLGQTVTIIMTLLTNVIFSRVLTKNDLAIYRQTMLAYEFITPILTLGIPGAMYYFLNNEQKEKKKIIYESIIIMLIAGVMFSVFLLLGGNEILARRFDNNELNKTLKWFTFYPIYTFPIMVLVPILIILGKVKEITLYNLITNILLSIFLIVSSYISKGYKIPLIIKIVFPLLNTPYLYYLMIEVLRNEKGNPKISNMIKMIKFSFPLGISSTLAILSVQLDKILVSSFTDPEKFAIYSNGAIEIPLIGIVTGSIGTIIMIDMKKYITENKNQEALNLYKNAAVKSSLILFPAMVFLFLFGKEFIELLFSKKYIESVNPFRIYLLLIPIRIMNYGNVLTILGKSKQMMIRGIGDLTLNLIVSMVFIKKFGFLGAAWGTIVTIYFWHVPYNLISISQGLGTSLKEIISYRKLLKIFLVSLISMILPFFIQIYSVNILKKFIFGLFIYTCLYLILSYIYIEEARELLNLIIKKFNIKKVIQKDRL